MDKFIISVTDSLKKIAEQHKTKTLSKKFFQEMLRDPEVKKTEINVLYVPFKEALKKLEQDGYKIEEIPSREELKLMLTEIEI